MNEIFIGENFKNQLISTPYWEQKADYIMPTELDIINEWIISRFNIKDPKMLSQSAIEYVDDEAEEAEGGNGYYRF